MRDMNFGVLLRCWRTARRVSQLELSLDADISTRHLSCVETGRAKPSREMVVRLAEALQVPLRERNPLLLAAGYAPLYRQTDLDTQELDAARRAVEPFLMAQHGAVSRTRHGPPLEHAEDECRSKATFRCASLAAILRNPRQRRPPWYSTPKGLRPFSKTGKSVAARIISASADIRFSANPSDQTMKRFLNESLGYPAVPSRLACSGSLRFASAVFDHQLTDGTTPRCG